MEASKSLGLGDVLTFLQKHFNQILQYKNPAYVFEFVGYEKDDPKLALEIMEGEVRSVKALNEKRAEIGMEAIDITKIKNPADLPMNPLVIQAWQSLQRTGGMGGDPFDMTDDDFEEGGLGENTGEGSEGESPEGDGKESGGTEQPEAGGESTGGGAWDEIEAQHGGAAVKKSLGGKTETVRVVV
jgi:hypothetical protein